MSHDTATTVYPLSWPAGRPRTPAYKRERPKFSAGTFAEARDRLLAELRRLGATRVILSTNVELRQDGLPYSGRRQPDDPGAAVYFTRKGRPLAMECDRWERVEQNLRAIADGIECIRTMERRGTGGMVDAAFAGFAALPPPPATRPWWEVMGVAAHTPTVEVEAAYRRRALDCHPDRNGGDDGRMKELNAARDRFRAERGLT